MLIDAAILAFGFAFTWAMWRSTQWCIRRFYNRRSLALERESKERRVEWLKKHVGNHTDFIAIFNDLKSADEVRTWIKTCRHEFFGEYPRDSGGFHFMVRCIAECRHSSELQNDVRLLEHFWFDEEKVRRGLAEYDS